MAWIKAGDPVIHEVETALPLPTRPDDVLEATTAWMETQQRSDGFVPWNVGEAATRAQLSQYSDVVHPFAIPGIPSIPRVAGYGDIPWSGSCSVVASLILNDAEKLYAIYQVLCGKATQLIRQLKGQAQEVVGQFDGVWPRMNGPGGWDRYRQAIAGAPYGYVCNIVVFLAWLRNPPKMPLTTPWTVPTIGVARVPMSAQMSYQLPRPSLHLTWRATLSAPQGDPVKVWVYLLDPNRAPLARTRLELAGSTSYNVECAFYGPIRPRGFIEVTPDGGDDAPGGFTVANARTGPISI